jgi:hypothetical protein
MRRKHPDRLVREEMHVGIRFPTDLAEKMKAIVNDANSFLKAQSMPENITVSGVVKAWIGERLDEEYAMLLNRQSSVSKPGRSNVLPFKNGAKKTKKKG